MAETTVTFLTFNPTTQAYTPEIRIFELEISLEAQQFFITCMQQLQLLQNNSDVAGMTRILKDLDAWSKFKYVYQGQEANSSGSIADITSPDPTATVTLLSLGTMDRYMAENVDKLVRTFRAAGYDPVSGQPTRAGITLSDVATSLFGVDSSLYDVAGTISKGLRAAEETRIITNVWTQSDSIQQLLMVDYVSRGNELLYSEMAKLKEAIDLNQSTLSYLNSLQDLMNQKDPQHFVMALQNLSGSAVADVAKYSTFEKESFDQELENVAKFSDAEISDYLKNILGFKPTDIPTPAQTAGTGLGAFQKLGDALTSSLNAYFAQKGLTQASVATLLPSIADYLACQQLADSFVATNSLSAAEKELIWRTFLVSSAGSNTLLPTIPPSETAFGTFLTSLGAPTSATLAGVLQAKLNALVAARLDSLLTADLAANPISGGGISTYPIAFSDMISWSSARSIIDQAFSSYNLSENDKLNIMRAFLKNRLHELNNPAPPVAPPVPPVPSVEAIDMTTALNLTALDTYAKNLAILISPKSYLSEQLLSDAGVTNPLALEGLYPSNLSVWPSDPTWPNGLISFIENNIPDLDQMPWITDTDKLNILRTFLIYRADYLGITLEEVDLTDPNNLSALGNFTYNNVFHGDDLDNADALYSNIVSLFYTPQSTFPSYEDLDLISPEISSIPVTPAGNLDWGAIHADWGNYDLDGAFSGFTAYPLSPKEKLNMVKAILSTSSMGNGHPETVDLGADYIGGGVTNLVYLQNSISALDHDNSFNPTNPTKLHADLANFILNTTESFKIVLGKQFPLNLVDWSAAKTVVENNFTLFSLSSAEKLNIIRAFLAQQGGDPTLIDITDPQVLDNLSMYVQNLSSSGYTTYVSSYLTVSSSDFPPNIMPWDTVKKIIQDAFSPSLLTDAEVLKIAQAFIAIQAKTQSLEPKDVDLSTTSAKSALALYAFTLSNNTKVLPVQNLTSLPTFSLDLYKPLLDDYFPSLSDADKTTVWKGFLITQGFTKTEDAPITNSTTRIELSQYLNEMKILAGPATGTLLEDKIYNYLYTKKNSTVGINRVATFSAYLNNTTYTIPSNAYTNINTQYPIPEYSATDQINVWKAFLTYTDSVPGDYPGLTINGLGAFVDKLKSFTMGAKGDALVTSIKSFLTSMTGYTSIETMAASQPTLTSLLYDASVSALSAFINGGPISVPAGLSTILSTVFPNPATSTDRLNVWKAYLAYAGKEASYNPQSTDPELGTIVNFFYETKNYAGADLGNNLITKLKKYLGYPQNEAVRDKIDTEIYEAFENQNPAILITNAEDRINIWKAFMIYNGNTNINAYTTLNSIANFTPFIQGLDNALRTAKNGLNSWLGPYINLPAADRTGIKLQEFLQTYITLPSDETTRNDVLFQLNAWFPTGPYTEEDRRNVWQAYVINRGDSDVDSTLSTFLKAASSWTIRPQTVENHPNPFTTLTGTALVDSLSSFLYQKRATDNAHYDAIGFSEITSGALPGTTAINYSTIMDQTLAFNPPLTDEKKLLLWNAFLAGDSGQNESMAIIDITSKLTMDRFKTFLNTMKPSDLGAAIDARMTRIIANLSYLIDKLTQVEDASSLAKELKTLRNDFQNLVTNNSPISDWVKDYSDGRIGDYQKHLNDAIVASQALNDTEREELRRVMFVYEEFYKSATAMLSRLTQLIEKMASAISR